MESDGSARFATLGHPQRLAVFLLLMRRYPDAVPAGEIAGALDLKASTLSVYLGALLRVGLVAQERAGPSRRYRIEMDAARALVGFLAEDCCRARPDLLAPHPAPVPRNLLFVCTGNSARSIIAEALLRRVGQGRFNAFSAGTAPRAAPHPVALGLLEREGHDTAPLRSRPLAAWTAPEAPRMDAVITVCDDAANRTAAPWPGRPVTAHWGLPDPAAATGPPEARRRAFERVHDLLRDRIARFAARPPADRPALQKTLDDLARRN